MTNEFDWAEYQEQANEFAIYKHEMYPIVALLEELGELAGKFAKSMRGDAELDVEAVKKEIGDVLWNAAMGMRNFGEDHTILYVDDITEEEWEEFKDEETHKLVLGLFPAVFGGDTSTFFKTLRVIARKLDFTLEDCATGNIIKLTSRKERDVIKGDGDLR